MLLVTSRTPLMLSARSSARRFWSRVVTVPISVDLALLHLDRDFGRIQVVVVGHAVRDLLANPLVRTLIVLRAPPAKPPPYP